VLTAISQGLPFCVCQSAQVLADIGDSQSLQQNLSTFSGHIARLKLLLGAAGQQSLVLLDEVGSGTDPLVSGCRSAELL
jgi:dsDNA-specific endonuclease/ATPase MutS2